MNIDRTPDPMLADLAVWKANGLSSIRADVA
jgi:hypothetical protein